MNQAAYEVFKEVLDIQDYLNKMKIEGDTFQKALYIHHLTILEENSAKDKIAFPSEGIKDE